MKNLTYIDNEGNRLVSRAALDERFKSLEASGITGEDAQIVVQAAVRGESRFWFGKDDTLTIEDAEIEPTRDPNNLPNSLDDEPTNDTCQCSTVVRLVKTGTRIGEPETVCVECGVAVCKSCRYLNATEPDGEGGAFGDDYHLDCAEVVQDSANHWNNVKSEYARSRGV